MINRIRLATDAIVAFSKAEMDAMGAHNAAVEHAFERRINAARQGRAALVASLQEHERQHHC